MTYSPAWKWAAEDCDGSHHEEKGVWSDWHHETRQPGFCLTEIYFVRYFEFVIRITELTCEIVARKRKAREMFYLPRFSTVTITSGWEKSYPKVLLKHKKHIRVGLFVNFFLELFYRILRTLTWPTRTTCWKSFLGSSERILRKVANKQISHQEKEL